MIDKKVNVLFVFLHWFINMIVMPICIFLLFKSFYIDGYSGAGSIDPFPYYLEGGIFYLVVGITLLVELATAFYFVSRSNKSTGVYMYIAMMSTGFLKVAGYLILLMVVYNIPVIGDLISNLGNLNTDGVSIMDAILGGRYMLYSVEGFIIPMLLFFCASTAAGIATAIKLKKLQ